MTSAAPGDDRWMRVVDAVAGILTREPAVEGMFLSGSLVRSPDWFSDVDLGVATKNSAPAFQRAWALRARIGQEIGPPVRLLERGWGHCRLYAVLLGKSLFPPIGLEVDVVFSQMKHVAEQMPHAPHRVVFDRTGRLRRMLAKLRLRPPAGEIRGELAQRMVWFGFWVHDALKAYGRRDLFSFQYLLEQMRGVLYHAVGERAGQRVYWSKWAFRYMTPGERKLVEASYRDFTPQTVRRLARAYQASLAPLAARYGLQQEINDLDRALAEIL